MFDHISFVTNQGEIMGDIRFRPLAPTERDRLRASLRRNVTDGAALLTGLDTSFVGDVPRLPDDEEVTAADRLIVESPSLTGLIVARAFSPEPSLLPTAAAALRAAQCKPQR